MTEICGSNDGINYSTLVGSGYRFYIEKAPYLNLFVQSIQIPSITLGQSDVGSPFTGINVPGDQLEWEPLPVTFVVDEDLNGYMEVYRWMRGLGFPTTFDEYTELVANERFTSKWQETTSDIQVATLTGSRNVNMLYNFVDAYPISLTAPILSSATQDAPTVTCTATFRYTYFDVKSIKNS